MGLFDRLPPPVTSILALRRTILALERQAIAQEQIAAALIRLADHLVPPYQEASEADLQSTGVSFSRDDEQAWLAEWRERFWRDIGREPTEEEAAQYLDAKERGEL